MSSILIVEDSGSDEKLALIAFRRTGVPIEVAVARDGAEALEYLFAEGRYQGRDAPNPAVIFLDLKLPRIDGLEVLRRIRADERTRSVPVVILTASREEKDVQRSYAVGANAYVRKPVEFAEFAEAAKTLVRFWVTLNEPAPRGVP